MYLHVLCFVALSNFTLDSSLNNDTPTEMRSDYCPKYGSIFPECSFRSDGEKMGGPKADRCFDMTTRADWIVKLKASKDI